MNRVVFWAKFITLVVIAACALLILVVLIMTVTSAGKPASPAWLFGILLLPPLGGYFTARYALRRTFQRTKSERAELSKKTSEAAKAAQDSERWRDRQFIQQHVDKHRPALTRNVRNAIVRNDYGVTVSDTRTEAILEFLASINFAGRGLSTVEAIEEVVVDLEGNALENRAARFDPTLVPIDGHEFENWVADALTKFGWGTSVTSMSGDQGIDVIAEKNGVRVGIQCKLYSQPVGNKAIQEAMAGAKYHGLHRAVVLSNASFTRSAQDLAASTDVLLISQFDLPDLERLVHSIRSFN